jgi:hypothetical protein
VRRLTLLALALPAILAAGVPARSSAALRPVELRSPASGSLVAVVPHADAVAGEVTVRGRAARGAIIEVRASCALGPCVSTATADRHGLWHARMTIVRRNVRGRLNLSARYVDTLVPSLAARRSVSLVLPAWASTPPYAGVERSPLLAMIGDSLAVGTEWPLRQLLPGWRVTSMGRVGRPLAEGMALLMSTPMPQRPAVWAFSLFTNDDPRNAAALELAVRASLDRIGADSCAIWATIARPRLGGVSYAQANRRLRALAADPAIGGRLVIVPWAAAVAQHREWLRKDHVHPTPAGYVGRAQMFAAAADQCPTAEG